MSNVAINNGNQEKPRFGKRWKLYSVILLLCSLLIAVIVKLFFIQIFDNAYYKETARRQHETRIPLMAERGKIIDRNGKLLVSTVKSISYAIDPVVLTDYSERLRIVKAVAAVSGASESELMAKIESAQGSFVWLARGIMPGNATRVDTISTHGFIKINEPKRIYLYGTAASQLLGTTDIDNNGMSGIEAAYDTILKGKQGMMSVYRDATGKVRPSAALPMQAPENGKTIQLTIDIELQQILEYELKIGVEQSGSAYGTAIAINPATGETLAMASYPGFDPNNPQSGTAELMRNRCVTDIYEPGSTFKIVTAAAALEEGIVNPLTPVNGLGGLADFNTYRIKDEHPLGATSFAEAVAFSSNIVFADIANRLDNNILFRYIRDFGFGLSLASGIPGEVSGKVKSIEDYDEPTKRFLGFGYGIAVTPLQILNSYSVIANKGIMMKPYVVSKVISPNGDTLESTKPLRMRQVVSEKTTETLTKMLTEVVERGTGSRAKVPKLKIAGKTGTSQQIEGSQYSKTDYNASFAGFFTADEPKIAMLVLLDKPRGDIYGGKVAAPIFASIVKRWIAAEPAFAANNSLSEASGNILYVPDFRGMFYGDALKIAKAFNLSLDFHEDTNSVILYQTPAPRSYINLATTIKLRSERQDSLATQAQEQPSLIGLSLRKAVAILNSKGIAFKVYGSGKIVSLNYEKDKTGKIICNLHCSLK